MRIGQSVLGAVALMTLFALGPAKAGNPSFDCDTAKSEVEKLICSDDELAKLDLKLARSFANALANASAESVGDLKSAQKAWRRDLMNCAKSGDERGCVADAYRSRLSQL